MLENKSIMENYVLYCRFFFFFCKRFLVGRGEEGFDRGLPRGLTPRYFFPCAFAQNNAQMHCGAGGTAAVVTSHGVDSKRVFSK